MPQINEHEPATVTPVPTPFEPMPRAPFGREPRGRVTAGWPLPLFLARRRAGAQRSF